MPSGQELDAQVARLRRTMRMVITLATLGAFVGIAVIVAVVGATLSVVDKNAARALKAEPEKNEQIQTRDARAGRTTVGQASGARPSATPDNPNAAQATRNATANPAPAIPGPPAPSSRAAQAGGAAGAETKPADSKSADGKPVTTPPPASAAAEATPPQQTEPAKKADAQEDRREHRRRRGYARVRTERPSQEAFEPHSDRTIVTRRPRYAREPEREAPRDSYGLFGSRGDGMFGTVFGRPDN